MTAAEAAAQIASLSAAAQASYNAGTLSGPGVTSLDQLKPGVSNNTQDTARLFAGGNALVQLNDTARGLKAGYYQLPGSGGAQYFDPSVGQASAEFVKWANSLTPDSVDPFTGQPSNFIPAEGGPQAAYQARADQSGPDVANLKAIIAGGRGADGTYQDSQDRVLGIGKYQQFMLDANGKQVRVADALSAAPRAPTYTDVSTAASKFVFVNPDGVTTFQGHWESSDAPGKPVPYSQVAADTKSVIDANSQHNIDAYSGLQQERIARGEDPNTGVSAAEAKSIYETYGRIADPAEKAAYIRAQDPGNLTAGLRVARTAARQGEQNWMTKNQLAKDVTWEGTQKYGGLSADTGQVKTTYSDVTMTDKTSGRSIMFGNVATSREYVAHDVGALTRGMDRFGGAMYGALKGFLTTGGPIGAALGALQGSGALGGMDFKNPGKTHWGASSQPGDIQNVTLDLGSALVFSQSRIGGMGAMSRFGLGVGIGSAVGFLHRGGGTDVQKLEGGAIQGGISGLMAGGAKKSANAKATSKFYYGA